MYWILAAIFLVIALAVPRLRPLGVTGCVVLGVLLAWGMVQRWSGNDPAQTQTTERSRRPASPVTSLQPVPVSSIVAENVRLSGGGAPFELEGRIVNQARDVRVKSVTIRVTRRDCYEGALDPSGCELLWQDRQWIDVSVPPQETRDFAVSMWMRGAAPRPRGTAQDTFEVVAASGEVIPAVEADTP